MWKKKDALSTVLRASRKWSRCNSLGDKTIKYINKIQIMSSCFPTPKHHPPKHTRSTQLQSSYFWCCFLFVCFKQNPNLLSEKPLLALWPKEWGWQLRSQRPASTARGQQGLLHQGATNPLQGSRELGWEILWQPWTDCTDGEKKRRGKKHRTETSKRRFWNELTDLLIQTT